MARPFTPPLEANQMSLSLSDPHLAQFRDRSPISSLRELGITSDEAEYGTLPPMTYDHLPVRNSLFYPIPDITAPPILSESLSHSFDATISQRRLIFEQLSKAEEEAKDALFTLHLIQQEMDQERRQLQSCLQDALEIYGRNVVERLIKSSGSTSKAEWQEEWDYEWVDDEDHNNNESQELVDAPAPSMEVPPKFPSRFPAEQPQASGSGTSHNGDNPATTPAVEIGPKQVDYRFKVPRAFIDRFGPVAYNHKPPVTGPSRTAQKHQTQRLQGGYTRIVGAIAGGDPVHVDTRANIEANHGTTRRMVNLVKAQNLARQAGHYDWEDDLWSIVKPDHQKMVAVDWLTPANDNYIDLNPFLPT